MLQGHSDYVNSVAFSPDSKYLASGSNDHMINLWSVKLQKEVGGLLWHSESIGSVVFSPDGKYLASGGCDN